MATQTELKKRWIRVKRYFACMWFESIFLPVLVYQPYEDAFIRVVLFCVVGFCFHVRRKDKWRPAKTWLDSPVQTLLLNRPLLPNLCSELWNKHSDSAGLCHVLSYFLREAEVKKKTTIRLFSWLGGTSHHCSQKRIPFLLIECKGWPRYESHSQRSLVTEEAHKCNI